MSRKITDEVADGWVATYWNGKTNAQIFADKKDIFGLKLKTAVRQCNGNVTFHVGYIDFTGNIIEIGYCRGVLINGYINGKTTANNTVVSFKMIG